MSHERSGKRIPSKFFLFCQENFDSFPKEKKRKITIGHSFIHNFLLRLAIYGRAVAVSSSNRRHWPMAIEWTRAKRQVPSATSSTASGTRTGSSRHWNPPRAQRVVPFEPREMIPFISDPAHLQVKVPQILSCSSRLSHPAGETKKQNKKGLHHRC